MAGKAQSELDSEPKQHGHHPHPAASAEVFRSELTREDLLVSLTLVIYLSVDGHLNYFLFLTNVNIHDKFLCGHIFISGVYS